VWEDHDADVEVIEAEVKERVVELAERAERPLRAARGLDGVGRRGDRALGRLHRDVRDARLGVDHERHVLVGVGRAVDRRCDGLEHDARAALGGRALRLGLRRELAHALLDGLIEAGARGDRVDEAPLDGALAAHALARGAEDVGAVAAHLALVDEAREPTGAGQHGEQRDLGQDTALLPSSTRRMSSHASASS
jgi:hypothetical protein